ncbi:MAG: sugar nucleotide-binding protein [Bacteroidetes bacterium]|nr:sugar nucleotide-binding protein [Bacteroidota bacterium]
MRKVLVTGSNGLLGQKLTDLYLSHPEVTLIATGRGQNRHAKQDGYIYEMMDVTDAANVLSVVANHKPDCIIHAAAMTNVDACELNPEECRIQNVQATANVVEAANSVNAHLVHVSTDFIFDGKNGPYKEDDEPAPVSIYGQSKLDAETVVIHKSKSWAIARTILVYGIVSDMSRSNIVLWAKNALEKQTPINVVNDQFRMPTLAEDLATGCYLIESKKASGVFNVSGKDFMSILQLVQQVGEHYGLSTECVTAINSESLNQPAKRPPVTGFDLTKSREILGYNPHSFDEGIDIVYQQFQQLQEQT